MNNEMSAPELASLLFSAVKSGQNVLPSFTCHVKGVNITIDLSTLVEAAGVDAVAEAVKVAAPIGTPHDFEPTFDLATVRRVRILKTDGKVSLVVDGTNRGGVLDNLVIHVRNENTKKVDTFELSLDVQGPTYHLLFSKLEHGRMKGLIGVREYVDSVGDDEKL